MIKSNWFAWLILISAWNFSYPKATPLLDIFMSAILSLIFLIINSEERE